MINSKESAVKALSDVLPENNFWVCDGSILKNLDELLKFLKATNNDVYAYHVNQEKNDFSNWMKDVIGDIKLAGDISKAKNKREAIKILGERVKWLRKKSEK